MQPASEIQVVNDHVLFWSSYDPKLKAELYSYVYRRGDALVIIDPIPLEESLYEELRKRGEPRAVVLTSETHERNSSDYRTRFSIPICASFHAAKGMVRRPDVFIIGNELLYGLTPIGIPGASVGETAYMSPEGTLFVGDALLNIEPDGLQLLPDKYSKDPKQSRESLRKLLDLPVKMATFAHGLPMRDNFKSRLKALLG